MGEKTDRHHPRQSEKCHQRLHTLNDRPNCEMYLFRKNVNLRGHNGRLTSSLCTTNNQLSDQKSYDTRVCGFGIGNERGKRTHSPLSTTTTGTKRIHHAIIMNVRLQLSKFETHHRRHRSRMPDAMSRWDARTVRRHTRCADTFALNCALQRTNKHTPMRTKIVQYQTPLRNNEVNTILNGAPFLSFLPSPPWVGLGGEPIRNDEKDVSCST